MPQNLSDPVKRQVDAYNRKDIDEFVACYSLHVVIEDATGAIVMRGHDAMRAAYSKLFRASPNYRRKSRRASSSASTSSTGAHHRTARFGC